MTKRFHIMNTCAHCGNQTTAETAFCRWMRDQEELDSRRNGIVRTDCDHIILRYKTHKTGRELQLMMIVEVKEFGRDPDPTQKDMLSFLSQTIWHSLRGKNMHKATTDRTLRLKSWILGRDVNVRNLGVHLLQFEKTSPKDSEWIRWNYHEVDEATLIQILAMNVRPDNPKRSIDEFLRDRHKKQDELPGLWNDGNHG